MNVFPSLTFPFSLTLQKGFHILIVETAQTDTERERERDGEEGKVNQEVKGEREADTDAARFIQECRTSKWARDERAYQVWK